MSILDIHDLVRLRTASGRIAQTTERLLSPSVLSSRLASWPPAWRFRKHNKAHKKLRERAIKIAKGSHWALCRTDVKSYFASIDIERLIHVLASWGCDAEALAQIGRVLRFFQATTPLNGLPVGPEASAIQGNAFLHAIDMFLEANSDFRHTRWMDDFYIFGRNRQICESLLSPLDEELAKLGLTRSLEKTFFFDSRQEAIDEIEDGSLTSAFIALQHDRPRGVRKIHEMFDEEIRATFRPNPTRFRAIIKTLTNSKDPYGAAWLAAVPEDMNVDPKVSSEYLAEVGLSNPEITDALYSKLRQPAKDEDDALDLHILRSLSRRTWGRPEGELFQSVARDRNRRGPIRAWACVASSRTPAWTSHSAMEEAEAETNPYVRRAILTTLRRSGDSPLRRRFFSQLERTNPEERFTMRWVESPRIRVEVVN